MAKQSGSDYGTNDKRITPRDAQKGAQGAVSQDHPEIQLDQGRDEKKNPGRKKAPRLSTGMLRLEDTSILLLPRWRDPAARSKARLGISSAPDTLGR